MYNYILVCFGTRPEYIKVKSIIDNIPNIKTCFTGQHEDLLKNINVTYKLNIDESISNNRLNNIICNIMKSGHVFENIECVLVQGDTTTALAMAISAFNHNIKVIHLEAGLRSNNPKNPFPEEMNRQLISRIADINLCPTEFNRDNLLKENVCGKIYVVGNTGLDNISKYDCNYGDKVLITLHRRDNHEIMDRWFTVIENIAHKYPHMEFMIPLHPNPNVQKYKHIFNKVKVVDPMIHTDLIKYVKECKFIISDSGGLQEECSYLNKKIIVCRKTTERPESIGIHSFVCNDPSELEKMVDDMMINFKVTATCPYGNGDSWKKISKIIGNYWNLFYKKNLNFTYDPSTFAIFVKEYLDNLKPLQKKLKLIDLGCGNGRDLLYFKSEGFDVTGLDMNCDVCDDLIKRGIDAKCGSIVDYDYAEYDIYYSRFSLHALDNYDEVLQFIKNISTKMKEDKSLLFIETRSIKGTDYKSMNYYEHYFTSGIGELHKRILINMKHLIDMCNENNLFAEYQIETNGLSIFKGEDPYLIRLILKKKDVKQTLQSFIEPLGRNQYRLGCITDKIIDLLTKNIQHCLFFGNLIGLLHHDNIFVP